MRDLLITHARYHHWATDRVLKSVEPIPDVDRKADAGLYFRSIHGTLNHLLLVDRLWRARFLRTTYAVRHLSDELESEFAPLAESLRRDTATWESLVGSFSEAELDAPFTYATLSGAPTTVRLADALLHVFNHGTHHRGQISAIVTRLGFPTPETDLVDLARM
ncbi:MAG TPA: DinB family protein [Kiritimatiellia bacterium]|nr:DinB family protein [Kiritimatiellia bacterium]